MTMTVCPENARGSFLPVLQRNNFFNIQNTNQKTAELKDNVVESPSPNDSKKITSLAFPRINQIKQENSQDQITDDVRGLKKITEYPPIKKGNLGKELVPLKSILKKHIPNKEKEQKNNEANQRLFFSPRYSSKNFCI